MAPKYELCVGLNKGHKTTVIKQKQYKGDRKEGGIRQARKKNVSVKIFLWLICLKMFDDVRVDCFKHLSL